VPNWSQALSTTSSASTWSASHLRSRTATLIARLSALLGVLTVSAYARAASVPFMVRLKYAVRAESEIAVSPAAPFASSRAIRAATRQAGVDDDGPVTLLLDAMMLTLERLGALTDCNAWISSENAAALNITLVPPRQAAQAETERFHASLDAAKAETIRGAAHHIARSAGATLTRRVKVFDRNTALTAAGVLIASIFTALFDGYWWGNSGATAAIHETEAGANLLLASAGGRLAGCLGQSRERENESGTYVQ
jgi:hypothetical protein